MSMPGQRCGLLKSLQRAKSDCSDTSAWFDEELAASSFKDARLGRRLRVLVERMWDGIGKPIPLVCQDWANTKAAYRFFSNERVSEAEILAGHFESTAKRFAACDGPVLVLQDTTSFSFQRENPAAVGTPYKPVISRGVARKKALTTCGILMHSSLAVTPEGLPLGLAAIKFWSRSQFKGCNALKRKINPTRVPIEQKESIRWLENLRQSTRLFHDPSRCVHVGDRESDIYELFCIAHEMGTHFLVRTCVDRLAGDGCHTIADEMQEAPVQGAHRVELGDEDGNRFMAVLDVKYRHIHVLPPIGKQQHYRALDLTVIHATEHGAPANRKPIEWKLITDLPVASGTQAIEKLDWYAQRWKIETFHKILKSGCRAEDARLRTAERLTNLIAVFCILSWRVFWLTMMSRIHANAPPILALNCNEIELLDSLVIDKPSGGEKNLAHYLTKIARLGGYLARTHDPPPGNIVMWRGLSRLIDIELGYMTGKRYG
jgi:hypothetical protein